VTNGTASVIQRFLIDVESVPRATVGALVVERGSKRLGAVLIERGRICWAVAAQMPRHLSHLLISRAEGLDEARLALAYDACRSDGRPFGEGLVESGLISAEGLRHALVDHTIDGLAALASERRGTTQRWLSREERSYDPRFTFSTVELAATAGAREHGDAAERSRSTLSAALPVGVHGAGVYRGDDVARPLLVTHTGLDGEALTSVESLCRWGISTLDLCTVFTDRTTFATATLSSGSTRVAWCERDLVHVAVCRDTAAMAKLFRRLNRK